MKVIALQDLALHSDLMSELETILPGAKEIHANLFRTDLNSELAVISLELLERYIRENRKNENSTAGSVG